MNDPNAKAKELLKTGPQKHQFYLDLRGNPDEPVIIVSRSINPETFEQFVTYVAGCPLCPGWFDVCYTISLDAWNQQVDGQPRFVLLQPS